MCVYICTYAFVFYIEVELVHVNVIDIHAIVVVISNLILSQTLDDTQIDGSWTFIEPITAKGQGKNGNKKQNGDKSSEDIIERNWKAQKIRIRI